MKKITSLLIALVFTCITLNTFAQAPSIAIQPFAGGFSSPVDIQNCGDSRIFVVEQDGYIRIITDSGTVSPTPFLDIDSIVLSGGEQGLLGLAFHPRYKENGYFYVYFDNNAGNLSINRYTVTADSNIADAGSRLNIITIPHPTNGNHNGGGLHFGPDGYLYIGTGDGGGGGDIPNNAQNHAQLLGKMLRLDVDGGTPYAIPVTNAYFNLPGWADEIWGLGLRNPWRWSFDRMTGDLWIGDVGQGAWEEIDFVPPFTTGGHNFGWRCYEGNHAYNTVGCQAQSTYDSAVYEMPHNPNGYCSVIGGYVYRGGKYGDMFGCYFFGDYCNDSIHAMRRSPSGVFTHYGTITYSAALGCFGEDAAGNIYVSNLNNGDIRKIVSTNCNPVAYVSDLDTVRVCADSILLQSPYDPAQIYSWNTPAGSSGGNQVWVSQSGWVKLTVINFSACSNVDSAYYEILGTPAAASFTGLDTLYCSNGSVADTLIGTPLGGLFNGQGVSQDVFDPAVSGDGIWVINYVYTDSNNCSSTVSQIVTVETCSNIAQTTSSGLQIMHINTTSESIELGVKSAYTAPATYVLHDCMGRAVSTGKMQLTAGEQTIQLPVQAEDGIYFWTLYSNQDAVTFRFAVTH